MDRDRDSGRRRHRRQVHERQLFDAVDRRRSGRPAMSRAIKEEGAAVWPPLRAVSGLPSTCQA